MMLGITIPDSAVKAEADRHNIGLMQAYRRIQAREYLKQRQSEHRAFQARGLCK